MRLAKRRSSTRSGWSPRPGAASTGSGPRSRRWTIACGGSSKRACLRVRARSHEALDDAARILDESIAQARPRYFAFIGSSGLEIGALADFLAHTYDINLAVDARAATQVEDQAVRWVAEFIGFPATGGAFTSGGTISNVSALAAARERAMPGSRHTGLGGRRVAVYCSKEVHYSVMRAVELLGMGSDNLRAVDLDGLRRMRPDALAEAIDADIAAGITPDGGDRDGRHHAHGRDRPARGDRRRV